ncbi:MAG: 16S rRNA (cytosine(1402)-N(4))-methyltransferase RsmH [Patescibacteria group bacterium]|jgi:16S rRNA (cytosine1402-N4)-methyltransferase|nr:16S rRNA (cytosine(1402)-N(4))-methyltransferase RsmH [Patescibacteria group bacterium]
MDNLDKQSKKYFHIPVMLEEIISNLDLKKGGYYIDCTLGGAGYTSLIAEKIGPEGKVLAIDLDDLALENAKDILESKGLSNVILAKSNFKNLDQVSHKFFPRSFKFDGIVFDLGLSSAQLDDESRGFSFKGTRPLNMAFSQTSEPSTEDIVNKYSVEDLAKIFSDYGEERKAEQIALNIVKKRKDKRIKTTNDLVKIIEEVKPFNFKSNIHPATKVFQALRIETNSEYKVLEQALEKAEEKLKTGGKLVVVSFHSGEDRIVKNFLRDRKNSSFKNITKKPIECSLEEADRNPRARSAKLRSAEKI